MKLSGKQTDNQRTLQEACERLFSQKFPVPVLDEDGELWASGNGYDLFIQKDGSHYELETISPKKELVNGNYHTGPEVIESMAHVPDQVVQACQMAKVGPAKPHWEWTVRKSGEVTELLLFFVPTNSSRMAAVLLVPRGHKTELRGKLYDKQNMLKLDVFWQLVKKGTLVQPGGSGNVKKVRAPNGSYTVTWRGQVFAKPADWPKIEQYADADFVVVG